MLEFPPIPAKYADDAGKPHMGLLPPPPHACQTCARPHAPSEPHDPTSLFWAVKRESIGWPVANWREACAHCEPETGERWMSGIAALGYDVDAPGGRRRLAS